MSEQAVVDLPDTAFGRAVSAMFSKVDAKEATKKRGTVLISGGCAVHIYTGSVRVSDDVDAEISRVLVPSDLSIISEGVFVFAVVIKKS